jgi:arginine-tRNA-protein transferase
MSAEQFPFLVVPGAPPEIVVYDQATSCPYLPDRVARMPLRLPCRRLRRSEVDERLATGDRRQGFVLYRTLCPACRACEPIRLRVDHVQLSRSQRRTLCRGDRELTTTLGAPIVDERRVELYNLHKLGRDLSDGHPPITREAYEDFLVNSCCDSLELRISQGSELVGVAILDRGRTSLSAVYCCYDPRWSRFGIGTYAILKELELCRRLGARHLYLGLFIADCRAMQYKARFTPHERLTDGRWQRFTRSDARRPDRPDCGGSYPLDSR